MTRISEWWKHGDSDRRGTAAAVRSVRILSGSELDQVAAAGGKAGASTNPIED
jgi:hypothetical protein